MLHTTGRLCKVGFANTTLPINPADVPIGSKIMASRCDACNMMWWSPMIGYMNEVFPLPHD